MSLAGPFTLPDSPGRRSVVPELLDALPPNDPEAVRSRRDLRLTNALIGNYRWLTRRAIRLQATVPRQHWVELGAGDGLLADSFSAQSRARLQVTGLDLAPRPGTWPDHWPWVRGNLFDHIDHIAGGGLMASLVLHHFTAPALHRLGRSLERFKFLLIAEPARSVIHHLQGRFLHPFVNGVTRHDMHASINAGFRGSELPRLLGLDESEWDIRTHRTPLGAYRVEARRWPP